jgi:hypothetical protein
LVIRTVNGQPLIEQEICNLPSATVGKKVLDIGPSKGKEQLAEIDIVSLTGQNDLFAEVGHY